MTRERRLFPTILWILFLTVISSGLEEQTRADSAAGSLPPGIGIQVAATPRVGTIGDRIRIDLEISMPPGYQVEVTPPAGQAGDFAILEFSPGSTTPDKEDAVPPQSSSSQLGKRLHYHAQIFAAVYKTGKFTFPSIRATLKTDRGEAIPIASDPFTIEIKTVLTDKDTNLKDLKKQADIPEPFRWAFWIGIALALLILGVFLWIFWKRHKRPESLVQESQQDPLDLAEAELRELLARGLPTIGMEKQFYIQLSEIVKRILEAAYNISTVEQTTSEIMDLLRSRGAMDSDNMARIESFLVRCDLVKFAKYIPLKDEHEAARDNALQILKDSRQWAVVSG